MVFRARPSLNGIGFRRDIKIFLGALVGYLVFLIVALLLVLQSSVFSIERSFEEQCDAVANALAHDLDSLGTGDDAALEATLRRYSTTFKLLGVELRTPTRTLRAGFPSASDRFVQKRASTGGSVEIHFDDSIPHWHRRQFGRIAAICLGSSVIVTVLLVLYIPRIVAPIEAMLDHAAAVAQREEGTGEEKFIVETFKNSIEMLSLQKVQLTRLHEAERTRAEELEHTAAGIAHEFRNSLATILGYLKLAQRDELPAQATERIQSADREAQLLTQAVERLLRFARPLEPDRQETCLLEMSHEIAARFRESADGITIDVRGEKASACVDVALMRIALENVLRNAIESIQRSPSAERRIDMEVIAQPQPAVVLRDTGAGIDPAEVPRLFQPFHSQRPGGVGLGLAMTRKIVQRHGGRVTLTGDPGGGAEVRIELPRDADIA